MIARTTKGGRCALCMASWGYSSYSKVRLEVPCARYTGLIVFSWRAETYLLVISSRRTIGQYASSDSKTVNGLTG